MMYFQSYALGMLTLRTQPPGFQEAHEALERPPRRRREALTHSSSWDPSQQPEPTCQACECVLRLPTWNHKELRCVYHAPPRLQSGAQYSTGDLSHSVLRWFKVQTSGCIS